MIPADKIRHVNANRVGSFGPGHLLATAADAVAAVPQGRPPWNHFRHPGDGRQHEAACPDDGRPYPAAEFTPGDMAGVTVHM